MRVPRVFLWLGFGCAASFGQVSQSPKVVAGYGNVPPVFEENRGQMDAEARYFLRGGNLNLFITKTGPVLALRKGETRAAVRMEVVGATGEGVVTGEAPTGGQSSYFRGKDPAKWVTGAPQFGKARIREVRRGVDLLCYPNERQFEYDLVVKPGTKPEEVRLRFAGAERVSLTGEGELKIETAAGELTQHRPKVWQMAGTRRESVEAQYRVLRGGEVAVVVGKYDRERELVIDPVVSYSTYLGGSGGDLGTAIAVDGSGNAYVTGQTLSANFPTTVGSYSVAEKGPSGDVFVSKLNSTGTVLLYSTYLGGSLSDYGTAIAINSLGNAYIAGVTQSSDFPTTTGVYQPSVAGSAYQTVFIAELSASGSALVYSTYLGGSTSPSGTTDQAPVGLQVDSSGNVYVAGNTNCTNFPTTAGAYATTWNPSGSIVMLQQTVFVAKLNPTATALVYSTYLGVSDNSSVGGIALDNSNEAYITGGTASANFPTTAGAFQAPSGPSVRNNAYVAGISADGASLKAATYLGGAPVASDFYGGSSQGTAIALDSGNYVYVTGYTYSTSFPTTPGAFSKILNGAGSTRNAFVTKFNPSLTSLSYSTYLGGSSNDQGFAIAVDAAGRAYVAGEATSPDFPITAGSLFGKKNGELAGIFLVQMDPTGGSLDYSTLLGGSGMDGAFGLAINGNQLVSLTGSTFSLDFPVTPGAFHSASTNPGNFNGEAFVTRLDLSSTVSCDLSISPSSYAAPLAGGSSSFAITVPQGCPWLVYKLDPPPGYD